MAKLTKRRRRKSQMLESYKCGVSYSSLTQRKKACTSEREALPDNARERASLIFLDHDNNDTSVGHGNKGVTSATAMTRVTAKGTKATQSTR